MCHLDITLLTFFWIKSPFYCIRFYSRENLRMCGNVYCQICRDIPKLFIHEILFQEDPGLSKVKL